MDIIDVFEVQFNIYAEKAESFASRFIRDKDSAIGTLYFKNFNVEFEYCLEYDGNIEKSGLNIIIDFSKRSELPLKCMVYDIIELIDKDNFNCWFYCYIENAERMKLCFERLSSDFTHISPKLIEFANSKDNLKKLEDVLRKNIKVTVGVDDINEVGDWVEGLEAVTTDDAYEYLYSMYFGSQQCIFASNEYRDFLSGDRKKALKKYEKKKGKLIYEEKLTEYLRNCKSLSPIIPKELECLRDGLKEYIGTSGFFPFIISCSILLIPFFVLSVFLYYLISLILYRNVIYTTAFEPYNALSCLLPAVVGSLACGYFSKEAIYRKFFKNKYQKMMDYERIFNTENTKKKTRVFLYLIYILVIIFVFLISNNAVSVSDTGLQVNETIFDINGNFYSYDEIQYTEYTDENYIIYFDNGHSLEMYKYAISTDTEQNILPLLELYGIETFYTE